MELSARSSRPAVGRWALRDVCSVRMWSDPEFRESVFNLCATVSVAYRYSEYSILSSSSGCNLVVPRTRRRIGDRAISVAAACIASMEQATDGAETAAIDGLFRRDLKTFLFHSVYGHQDTD